MNFLSIIFGNKSAMEADEQSLVSMAEEESRKRPSGSLTPSLLEDERPVKRFRGECRMLPLVRRQSPMSTLPEDVVAHCLSFLGDVENRHAIQNTCVQFRRISNTGKMRKDIAVGGDRETGLHGIIQEDDTPATASRKLIPYARAENWEAIYMYVVDVARWASLQSLTLFFLQARHYPELLSSGCQGWYRTLEKSLFGRLCSSLVRLGTGSSGFHAGRSCQIHAVCS